jgi:hypothetical protein
MSASKEILVRPEVEQMHRTKTGGEEESEKEIIRLKNQVMGVYMAKRAVPARHGTALSSTALCHARA